MPLMSNVMPHMQASVPSWLPEAIPVEDSVVDIGFLVQESFYYGPENGFSPQQWQELREAVYQPSIKKSGNFILSADVLGKESELAAHYKDVAAKALAHRRSLKNSSHFWNRPVVYSTDKFVLSFPWHDKFCEGKRLLGALANGTGEVLWDRDQGWELEVHRVGDSLYAREGDPDDHVIYYTVKLPYEPIKTQIEALLPRVESLIAFLAREVGQDYWS